MKTASTPASPLLLSYDRWIGEHCLWHYIAHPEPAQLFLALSVLALAVVYFETGLK